MTLFPRTLTEHGYKLADDLIVAVRGASTSATSRTTVICQTLEVLAGLEDSARR